MLHSKPSKYIPSTAAGSEGTMVPCTFCSHDSSLGFPCNVDRYRRPTPCSKTQKGSVMLAFQIIWLIEPSIRYQERRFMRNAVSPLR